MSARGSASTLRLGAITVVSLLVVMAAAFNLQNFPGFKGTSYHAEFKDASGLHVGSEVQVAGIRVGRVTNITIRARRVLVDFDVKGAVLGRTTHASVQVQNLLGEKFLDVVPQGGGEMPDDATIPLSRTDTTFDIVGTMSTLTRTTEQTDKRMLGRALNTVAGTLDQSAPDVRASFRGVSRLSRTIAARDAEISALLRHSRKVTGLLQRRRGDLVVLMRRADLVFAELRARKTAIHSLLVNVRVLSTQLRGLVRDNQAQLNPTLHKVDHVLRFLEAREARIRRTLHTYGPYVNILGNIIGTGPWFDSYVPNIGGVFTGEFRPAVG